MRPLLYELAHFGLIILCPNYIKILDAHSAQQVHQGCTKFVSISTLLGFVPITYIKKHVT